jgi:hypothetical protein
LVASLEGYTPFEFQQKNIRDPLAKFHPLAIIFGNKSLIRGFASHRPKQLLQHFPNEIRPLGEADGRRCLMSISTKLLSTFFAGLVVIGLVGCKQEGPAERAGKTIDEAVEKTGEQIEKAGEKIKESAK